MLRSFLAIFLLTLFPLSVQSSNRLQSESSPYLQQHAHNPIQWYPWGQEAFDKAKVENKPIFLSIGYSTCHWCHVMNEESFEDNATAAFLNEHFVSIKVDRESRPDLDETYMLALSLMNSQKGWPLNIFLTPDAKPIFGTTYLSNERFLSLALKLSDIWNSNPKLLIDDAEEIYAMMEKLSSLKLQAGTIDKALIDHAIRDIVIKYDPKYGGFGIAPKFPNEPHLDFLLRHYRNDNALVIRHTLEQMANSTLYDQLGGGFHRYSTDQAWKEPHFEKMLYNQAQLSKIYAQGYQRFGLKRFKEIVTETNTYVLQQMRSLEGLFYTAEDAGGKDAEGIYYLWKRSEILPLLLPSEQKMADELFHLNALGAFGENHSLSLHLSLNEYAKRANITPSQAQKLYQSLKQKLLTARAKRHTLHRDEKIITAYNAMMIDSLAETSQLLNEPRYLSEALKSAEMLWKKHTDAKGNVYRSSYRSSRSVDALLDDYAYFGLASIRLYDITKDEKWLKRSQLLADTMIERFYDTQNGGFFMNPTSELSLIRPKEVSDRYTYSANGAALHLLKALMVRNTKSTYERCYTQSLAVFSTLIRQNPSLYTSILSTLDIEEKRTTKAKQTTQEQYGSGGAIRATLERRSGDTLLLTLDLRTPWHINTNRVQDASLKPTSIKINGKGWKLLGVHYPKGVAKKVGSMSKTLTLYEGKIPITLYLKGENKNAPLNLSVEYQACSDTTCLAPEILNFIVSKP